jgi:Asp-tRNA(Asn)/Glu-tRNA(Gln) amidotransferase A subunit family amidase
MTELCDQSALELRRLIGARQVSPVELLASCRARVERVNGALQNTVIHTFPRVSQFWKYDPAEFLRQPVYARDVPPCRHC